MENTSLVDEIIKTKSAGNRTANSLRTTTHHWHHDFLHNNPDPEIKTR